MNWHEEVANYIEKNFDNFLETFFGDSQFARYNKGVYVNPSPCCGHNDCFSFGKQINGFNCFGCGEKGTRIRAVELALGTDKTKLELEKWSGIVYVGKDFDEKYRASRQKHGRLQDIYKAAIEHYAKNLFRTPDAFGFQMSTDVSKGHRSHSREALQKFNVGLSGNYQVFYDDMIKKGYSKEELKEAGKLIWVPEGYFVYPYYDKKGNLVRINGKLFIRKCKGKKQPDGSFSNDCDFETKQLGDTGKVLKKSHETMFPGHKMNEDGFSRGDKLNVFYHSKNALRGQRFLILVEGENDVISIDEEIEKLPARYKKEFTVSGLGGRADDDTFNSPFLRQFDAIYECFDHDDGGDGYRAELNEKVPDVPLYSIRFDDDYNDIDAYLKSSTYAGEFADMLTNASFIDTKKFVIIRDGKEHIWTLKNRKFEMVFAVSSYNRNASQLEGTMNIYKSGQIADKKIGGIDKIKVDASLQYAKLEFSQHLNQYYNEVQWLKDSPKRDFWELADILRFSKEYHKIIKQLAWYLYHAETKQYELYINKLQNSFNQQIVAEVLKDVNGFQNVEIDPHRLFPKMTLSQFFSRTNKEAFFYFSKVITEGDTSKVVPCLVSNKKEEIRLDLLKRKDPQCMLLINNRYELPFEVPTAIMDPIEVSLQPFWVDQWKNNELDPASYDPKLLIQEIEAFIRRSYYMKTDAIKVLSLWIYATYFYMMFQTGFPYLMFNGAKGTGKSTLDMIVYLLSLNAKFALDMSESALFRTISFEGGTFILDEVENLTDKGRVDSNGYAKILKGGYADAGSVYRTNTEKGIQERFSVFGPKVISNINGLDDVIGDRCIFIKTYSAPEEKLRELIDPQIFKQERRNEAHSITSRCAISALEHFETVNDIFYNLDSRLETGNARLTQIIRPLLTMAKLVGGDYEENLMRYYNREIKHTKDEISAGTIEGMIKNLLVRISEEVHGIEKERWALTPDLHLYNEPIRNSADGGGFELDTLHIKILCEELNNNEEIRIKEINAAMKNVLHADYDLVNGRTRTTVTIRNDELRKHLGDKSTMKIYKYFLNTKDYLSPVAAKIKTTVEKAEDSLF